MSNFIMFSVFTLISYSLFCCNTKNSKNLNKNDIFSEYSLDDTLNKSEKLQKFYKLQDCESFINEFPSNFESFLSVYGIENKIEAPNANVSMEHISFFFKCQETHFDLILEKASNIALNGKWQADGVNHFQRGLLIFIINNNEKSREYITQLDNDSLFKLCYFLFDGPSPNDSVSYRNYTKLLDIFGDSTRESKNLKLAYDSLLKSDW